MLLESFLVMPCQRVPRQEAHRPLKRAPAGRLVTRRRNGRYKLIIEQLLRRTPVQHAVCLPLRAVTHLQLNGSTELFQDAILLRAALVRLDEVLLAFEEQLSAQHEREQARCLLTRRPG